MNRDSVCDTSGNPNAFASINSQLQRFVTEVFLGTHAMLQANLHLRELCEYLHRALKNSHNAGQYWLG